MSEKQTLTIRKSHVPLTAYLFSFNRDMKFHGHDHIFDVRNIKQ